MKIFTIDVPELKCEVLFVGNCDSGRLRDYLRSEFDVEIDDIDGEATVLTLHRAPWRVVWQRHMKWNIGSIGELAHELFHLVVRICKDKGIPIRANIETGECGDEAAAYLMDFLMCEAINAIKPKLPKGDWRKQKSPRRSPMPTWRRVAPRLPPFAISHFRFAANLQRDPETIAIKRERMVIISRNMKP